MSDADHESLEVAYFLGRPLRIDVAPAPWKRVTREGDVLRVTLANTSDARQAGALLEGWFLEQANATLPVFFREAVARLRDHLSNANHPISLRSASCPDGLRLTVRRMRTRWGSCSRDGRISLSTELIRIPRTLIDYVIVHELCHLVRLDHSRAYYFNLARCMPDWRERRRALHTRSWMRRTGGLA